MFPALETFLLVIGSFARLVCIFIIFCNLSFLSINRHFVHHSSYAWY